MTERKTWTPGDVVDVSGPPALVRNYLEQGEVRRYLQRVARDTKIARAYDVGCGFGRLTPVLAEFATEVRGFERESSLLAIAASLLPALSFTEVQTLDRLPAQSGSAQFVLIFTVVQHMPDDRATAVLGEVLRLLAPGGHLLLVEETDATLQAGNPLEADRGYTRGRSVEWYADRLQPCALLETSPRRIEPGYPRADVGTYMLFRAP
jgi:SAM-dependent methyltransferase